MPWGSLSPEMSEALTVAPEVVYSPIVPAPKFVTKMSDPDTAMPSGSLSPEMSEALTVAPEVVYSPIVSAYDVRDKNVRPGHRDARWAA